MTIIPCRPAGHCPTGLPCVPSLFFTLIVIVENPIKYQDEFIKQQIIEKAMKYHDADDNNDDTDSSSNSNVGIHHAKYISVFSDDDFSFKLQQKQ